MLETSKHAELMTLACKHAILQQGPAHLIFPDEVQVKPAGDEPASGPDGRLTALQISPPAESLRRALELLATAKRPVIIVGHGARFASRRGGRARRAARRARDHDIQGQGPDRG